MLAALDAYEHTSHSLVANWPDSERYAEAVQRLEPVRQLGLTLPSLTIPSLLLAIAHAELVSLLWEASSSDVPPARMQIARQRHAQAVQVLRLASERLVTPPH